MLGQGPFGRPNLAAIAGEGGLSLAPALWPSQTQFYAPVVAVLGTQFIAPVLFLNSATAIYQPALTTLNEIRPEKYTNQAQFYAPILTLGITPERFENQSEFYAPFVLVQQPMIIAPGHFENQSQFYEPFVDMQFKFLNVAHFDNTSSNRIWQPRVIVQELEPTYDYPIGNDLGSDYGIRESLTFYKQRLVLGHRYGRRR